MIDLNTDIACRTRTRKGIHLDVLAICEDRILAHTEVGLGNLREGGETRLEVLFLTFHFILEVTS